MDPVPNENNEFETESSETEEDFDDTDSHYTDVEDDCSESENSLDVSLDVDEDEDGFEIDDSDEEDSEEEDDGDRCLVEITKPYNPITSNDSILETDYDEVSHSDWGNLKAFIMLADGQQIAEWFKQRKISQEAKQNIGKVFSPLNLAARVSSPQIFNFLLGEGFPLNTIIHPFLDAALNHRFDIMQTLLDIGADINVTDAAGTSALHLVARQMTCKPKKIKFLLSRGANIEQKDNSGMTSLHYALLMGSRGTVVTLLRAGASVKERNGKGRPVLHMAVYRGHKMTRLVHGQEHRKNILKLKLQ